MSDGGASLRGLGDLVTQVAGFIIAAELAQRCLVQLKTNLAQLLGLRIPGCETLSVNLAQRADQGIAVLVADFTILVPVASGMLRSVNWRSCGQAFA